ncbi:hypothetical protein BGZ74_007786 [Mortierella antarctica]|nr:hypothetical protein BGZ74_007786 [Mortierella antarctica]
MNTTPTNNFFASAAAERLLQSASSLDSALSSDKKRNSLVDFGSLDTIFGASELSATLFDDWLMNDVQQASLLGTQDDFANFSSDSDSNSGDSPVVGFDSIATDVDLMMGQTTPMALFPEIAPQVAPQTATGVAPAKPVLPLSPDAVRQAAAALNIPWSKGLEEAVLAQSLLASIPMTLAMPLASPATAAAQIAPAAAPEVMTPPSPAVSTPASPSPRSSPAPQSQPMERERSTSVTPSIAPSTPRMSLSILSTQTTAPVGNSGVKATVYKSAYRQASLSSTGRRCNMNLKRNDREWDDTPSVLEGKDVSEMDEVALKRAKNTDAARRSRRKKLILMEGLEQRVAELEVENSMFESKLNEVELERSLLADKDQMQQARIMELEAMLSSLRQKMY